MMLGKENLDGNWCYLCQLYIDEWKRHDHKHLDGVRWTLQKLVDQASKCSNLEGKDRMGVREVPYFDISMARYIWPILHTLIGVGNGILDYLIDIIESEIQHIPAKEVCTKCELCELEKLHKELQTARNEWDSGEVGSGIDFMRVYKKDLWRLETEMERLEDIGAHLDESYANLFTCTEMTKERVAELELERSKMTIDVAGVSKAVSKKKENVAACRRARKCESDSMYTGVDLIL